MMAFYQVSVSDTLTDNGSFTPLVTYEGYVACDNFWQRREYCIANLIP